jgi:nucleotide-binding universal stress UspA family protein
MRWIVGIDLRARCRGALAFCDWVAANSHAADGDRFEAIHVLEERDTGLLKAHVSLAEIERLTRESVGQALEGAPRVSELEIVHARTAAEALAHRVADEADAALVVGRQAPMAGTGWVRLGRIARRLVRRTPAPVVVVPPDLKASDLGDGPVVLATSLKEDCAAAAAFALRLSKRWRRRVLAVHVVPGIDDAPPHYVPAVTRHQLLSVMRLEGQRGLEAWLREHDLRTADAAVATGDVFERVRSIAQEEKAPIIVVGSRRLPAPATFFSSSFGLDLAGSAPGAVAVVGLPQC